MTGIPVRRSVCKEDPYVRNEGDESTQEQQRHTRVSQLQHATGFHSTTANVRPKARKGSLQDFQG